MKYSINFISMHVVFGYSLNVTVFRKYSNNLKYSIYLCQFIIFIKMHSKAHFTHLRFKYIRESQQRPRKSLKRNTTILQQIDQNLFLRRRHNISIILLSFIWGTFQNVHLSPLKVQRGSNPPGLFNNKYLIRRLSLFLYWILPVRFLLTQKS